MSHGTLYVYLCVCVCVYISASMERTFFVILQNEEVVIAWQMSRFGKSIQFEQGACNATVVTLASKPRSLQPWNGALVRDNAMPTSPYRIDHQKTRVHETKRTIIYIAAFSIIITFLWSQALFIVPKINPTVIRA
jgi:hypothetical protein